MSTLPLRARRALRRAIETLENRRLLTVSGSSFESSDGNLIHATGMIDWDNAPNLVVALDKPTGQSDDSFQGSKEDDAAASVGAGSIPNNKSDLARFYMSNQSIDINNDSHEFIYLGWERVNTLGTANIDFEFNQSQTLSSNGVTPLRTVGDILITFDFASGGNHVDLGMRRWTGSAWGAAVDLDAAGFADGAVNNGSVIDPIAPGAPRTLPDNTFGEAAIDLTASGAFPVDECFHLGSVYAKSRSSDSFTSAMKDFIAPMKIAIASCPDVTVLKTADQATISTGDTAGFTVTVTNTGIGTAKSVTLNDPLPSGINWQLDAASVAAGFSIANNVLLLGPVSMAGGTSKTAHITGLTDAGDCGTLTNTATVSSTNEPEDDQGNNESTATITVNCPDVAVVKTPDKATINTGDQAGFTITITNNGLGNAYNVSLTDTLPSGVSWSISPASSGFSIAGGVLSASFATLAPGASKSVHIIGTTDAEDCGTLSNTATVSASNEGADHLSDNTSTAQIEVQCPDVTVLKVADAHEITAGDQIGFTITLSNIRDGAAYNVTLSDTLPTGLTWSISPASSGFGISGGSLSANFASLASGASKSVHIVATTGVADIGTIPNTAIVAASNEPSDHTDNNSSSDSVLVSYTDLKVAKASSSAEVTHDQPFTYTITVINDGNGAAKNVTVSDVLDSHLVVNSISYVIGNASPVNVTVPATNSLSINVGTLAASDGQAGGNDTAVVTLNVTPELECGKISNTATVSASNEPVANQSNNTSNTVVITVFPDGDVGLLYGLPFESTDGNMINNNGGSKVDWADYIGTEVLKVATDQLTGTKDNAFGQGTKEDDGVPKVVAGSIPNNKSDLLRFYVASDNINQQNYLYLGWVRANTLGTANMDFEFNQSNVKSSNGVTFIRTAGDLLITFDFANGGTTVALGLREWQPGGFWGASVNLNSGGVASGSVNNSAFGSGSIFDPIANKTLAANTFGEASINLSAVFAGRIPPGECVHFANAYLKSRSSASFTSEIKDFIAPISVGVVVFNPDDVAAAAAGEAMAPAPSMMTTTSSASTASSLFASQDDDALSSLRGY
jgi:uncharacterized repeat protein (TIGR01451 family)